MTAHMEFNARPLPPAEVARSFVPPRKHLTDLLSRNHTLVLGPRGSGKTTLLKMLTVRGLKSWDHHSAPEYSRLIRFNAAFVPADIAWGKQIQVLQSLDFNPVRNEAAFVVHTLRALIRAMRDAVELGRDIPAEHLAHLAVSISEETETSIARLLAEQLDLSPPIMSLLGIENAFERLLDRISAGERIDTFVVATLQTKLSLVITAFNGLAKDNDRRWGLLFDEMEIAPTAVKSFLLSGIRSFDDRIIIKMALAPYVDDATLEQTPNSAQPWHDYHTVQLTYPNKDDAYRFTEELFRNTFDRLGFPIRDLPEIFASRVAASSLGGRKNKGKRRSLPMEFRSLAEKDESFNKYALERGIFHPNYDFTENNNAKDIRKVLPIVVTRDYYLKFADGTKVVGNRSRKSPELYTGYPSVLEITEGNPRAILTLIAPLVRDLSQNFRERGTLRQLAISVQSEAVRRVELLLTSLLQVIPVDLSGSENGYGLLGFVDKIGWAFESRLLGAMFASDYVGTFVIDDKVPPEVVKAVGAALNAGAVIHVPQDDSGTDSLLRGLRGKRFRISYALAARYRMLLTLGDRVNLSRLLRETGITAATGVQAALFDDDGA